MNDLVGKEFRIHEGFVQLIDYMGSDDRIADSARVSYGAGTKSVSDNNHLINYLMRHRHTTPFEQCVLTFRIKVPMDIWRQWIRHRTASVNEYSTRYSIAIDDKKTTDETNWRKQSKLNNQGSSDEYFSIIDGTVLSEKEKQLHELSDDVYKERLQMGVAREQARKDLPLSTYTIAYWTIDLHNLLHFLKLRMDSHAQKEIREYANVIGNIVSILFPNTWDAFNDYILNAVTLTAKDIEMIKMINNDINPIKYNMFEWFNTNSDGTFKNNRERIEFEEKAKKMELILPWIEKENI